MEGNNKKGLDDGWSVLNGVVVVWSSGGGGGGGVGQRHTARRWGRDLTRPAGGRAAVDCDAHGWHTVDTEAGEEATDGWAPTTVPVFEFLKPVKQNPNSKFKLIQTLTVLKMTFLSSTNFK
jgi:hypothetical protein